MLKNWLLNQTKITVDSPENNPSLITINKKLNKIIELSPKDLNAEWKKNIENKLLDLVGKIYNNCQIINISPNSLKFGDGVCGNYGAVYFNVEFQAEVYEPKENDVMDICVYLINNYGVFGRISETSKLITENNVDDIFVPKDYLNDYFRFNRYTNSFESGDNTIKIKKGSILRVKIVSVLVSVKKITMVGTTQENYLGVIKI